MKILVLMDGSMWSHKAALHAMNLAKRKNADVVFFSVLDEKTAKALAFNFCVQSDMCDRIMDHEKQIWRDMKKSTNEEMAGVLHHCNSMDVSCTAKIVEGDRKKAIVEEANTGEYNLVVMGAYGRDAKTEIGSLSTAIIREMTPPLIIVH
jgi:nucleotide-binding universal stress UspA family protein